MKNNKWQGLPKQDTKCTRHDLLCMSCVYVRVQNSYSLITPYSLSEIFSREKLQRYFDTHLS